MRYISKTQERRERQGNLPGRPRRKYELPPYEKRTYHLSPIISDQYFLILLNFCNSAYTKNYLRKNGRAVNYTDRYKHWHEGTRKKDPIPLHVKRKKTHVKLGNIWHPDVNPPGISIISGYK